MATQPELVTLAVQLAGKGRTELLEGVEHRVFSAVLVRAQVLNNNLGRTFLPPEEITQQWADTANGAPVILDHPSKRGLPVSARDPDVLNSRSVGRLFRARAEGDSIKADVFLNPARSNDVPQLSAILARLDAGEATELSTGFPLRALDAVNGTHDGKPYDLVLRPAGFDHLAVFSDKLGACSVRDGCGLGVNHAGECEESAVDEKAVGRFEKAINALSEKLTALLSGKAPEPEAPGESAANEGEEHTTSDEGSMNREQIIAQLAAAGRDKDVLNKLSDCDLKAIAGATNTQEPAIPEPTGDGWEKAKEYRTKLEALEAKAANALAREAQERADMLDDLLYRVEDLPYSENELKSKDIVELRKIHKTAIPSRDSYAGRGGPTGAANGGISRFGYVVNDVIGGVVGKEAN